jgi:hypothetical protein
LDLGKDEVHSHHKMQAKGVSAIMAEHDSKMSRGLMALFMALLVAALLFTTAMGRPAKGCDVLAAQMPSSARCWHAGVSVLLHDTDDVDDPAPNPDHSQ